MESSLSVPRWATGGGVALVGLAVGLHNGLAWAALPVGAALLGTSAAAYLYPWWGDRVVVRVYYQHTGGSAPRLDRILRLLAAVTERGLQAVWHREGDDLALYIELAAGGQTALGDLLAASLAGVELVPVAALPTLAHPRWYAGCPLDPATVPTDWLEIVTAHGADLQLRLSLAGDQAAALLVGSSAPTAGEIAIPAPWRPFGRGPGAAKRQWWITQVPHVQSGDLPALPFPPTTSAITAALDSRRLHRTLSPTYAPPDPALVLGWTAERAPVRLGLAPAIPAPLWVLGGTVARRAATVSRLLAAAQAAGSGVVTLPAPGETADTPASVAGVTTKIDLEHPAASVHLNLLAPAPTDPIPALDSILRDRIPLLSLYLALCGLPTWSGPAGQSVLLDLAHLAALRAYRSGDPWPDLGSLLEALSGPESLSAAIVAEGRAWAAGETLKGLPGALAERVAALLADLHRRWAAVPVARARLLAAQTQTRVETALGAHPWLTRAWPDALTPAALFNATPPPSIRLLPAPRERAARPAGLYLLAGLLAAAQDRQAGAKGAPLLVLLEDPTAWLPDGNVPGEYAATLAAAGITLILPRATRRANAQGGAWLAEDPAGIPQADLAAIHLPTDTFLVQLPGPTAPEIATLYPQPPGARPGQS